MDTVKRFLVTSSVMAFPSLVLSVGSVLIGLTRNSIAFAQQAPIVAPVNDVSDIQDLFCNIIGWFIWFMIVISVIMILVAAFDYITAGDDTEKTSRGRKRLTYAAIGLVIAFLAFVFPQIISSLFNGSPLFTLDQNDCNT